jgi:Recombination endonuclease VII
MTKIAKRQYNKMRYSRLRTKIRKQQRKYFKQYYKNNKIKRLKKQHDKLAETYEQRRGYALKAKYGLTFKEYQSMLKIQNYRCAICGHKNKHWYALAVDHNHKTGQIRKLLCNSCNAILGHANDCIATLKLCIQYIEKER